MVWPDELSEILEKYYVLQKAGGNQLTYGQKQAFVRELKEVYDSLPAKKKIDVLVPSSEAYVADSAICKYMNPDLNIAYAIEYNWPNDAYMFPPVEKKLEIGEEYDRIGSPFGRFLCPLAAGSTPQPLRARAVPYYVPESDIRTSPAYHKYTVVKRYSGKKGAPVLFGKIAPAFCADPLDGGGTQVELPRCIDVNVLRGDVLDGN